MSGPIGVMSAKFALVAGVLLLSARVELHRVSAVLQPSLPVTAVSPDLALDLGMAGEGPGPQPVPRKRVIGIDHAQIRFESATVSSTGRNQLTLGEDVLREMKLGLDFRKNRLDVMMRGEFQSKTKNMRAVPITFTPDGCISIEGVSIGGDRMRAALLGTVETEGPRTVIRVGPLSLRARAKSRTGLCSANDVLLGWDAFAGSELILDVGGKKIWVPWSFSGTS